MGTSPSELQRLLAAEFDRRRWEYDLSTGRRLIEEVERAGLVDPSQLAQLVSAGFLRKNHTDRSDVAEAIERAIGGHTPGRERSTATLIFSDNRRYELTLAPGAQLRHSKVNVGGNQIVVGAEADKAQLLAGVEALLKAGLAGSWDTDAAGSLEALLADRADITIEDIRRVAVEVLSQEQPKQSRAREFLERLAASGLGGALGTGLSAGVGELLSQLPLG
jgi:hypothetical protein